MQSFEITRKFGNMKIENVLQSMYPRLSYNTLQKAFRKRDVKVNGTRVGREYIVVPGDMLEVYIRDDLLYGLKDPADAGTAGEASEKATANYGGTVKTISDDASVYKSADLSGSTALSKSGESVPESGIVAPVQGKNTPERGKVKTVGFEIVYEDENILIVNKEQGIPVHPDRVQTSGTLIDFVRLYLQQKGELSGDGRFQPSLCHRLDRNTGGLVIIAKNEESYDIILKKIENREIKKYYQCLVKGKMERNEAKLRAFLWKDASKSRVFINERKTPGAAEIVTGYKVLNYNRGKDVSRLEVELVTGRTHQIRAHLAFTGHPIMGDGKYGKNEINRAFGLKQQALWACRLKFDFTVNSGILHYLKGREFQVEPGFPRI